MSELNCGQFVKYVVPNRIKAGVGLLVADDDYVAKRRDRTKLVFESGASLPLDALKERGGEVVEVLPNGHPEAHRVVAGFMAPEGFVYEQEPVVKTYLHQGCLVAYINTYGAKVRVLPITTEVSIKTRNLVHAIHSFKRVTALPQAYRDKRFGSLGKGDFLEHELWGRGVHLGHTILFEKPRRLWPQSRVDLRFADWSEPKRLRSDASFRDTSCLQLDFDRNPSEYPEPNGSFGPNSFDLPHEWEKNRSHCSHCGSDSLRSKDLTRLGIVRFCQECTWTGLVPTVRTSLRTILAAEQEFRISSLS